jgi:hypothetical protein
MNRITNRLTCGQANQIDLVDYLNHLNYHPSKIKKQDYWYRSPLREEHTASFKVNRAQNIWYDHGLGKGGNFVDFATLYYNCSVKVLLEKLDGNFSFHPQPVKGLVPEVPAIKILSEKNLSSVVLIRYLKQRRIAESVAMKYCKEVLFSLHEKNYTAIGFKNNEGGYELRNAWFKGSTAPKAITSFENDAKELMVFEGFFNFLSFQTIHKNESFSPGNFLILNSAAFFEKSRDLMERYESVRLLLDNDKTGMRCTQLALSWSKKYCDESHLYKGYKDLNEWMQFIGKTLKNGLRQ